MWFKERNGKKISFSNVGDDAMLQDDFYFGVRLHKWSSVDERWDKAPFIIPSNPWLSLEYESITLEFEKLSLQSGENVEIIYVSQHPI